MATAAKRADIERDEELVTVLRNAVTRLARSQRAHGTQSRDALPFSLMSVLAALERNGPMTPTALANAEGVRKPSMTRAMASLQERGLIARADDPDDGRQSVVEITSAGRRELRKTRAVINDWYLERLSVLTPAEVRALRSAVGALSRLADGLQ